VAILRPFRPLRYNPAVVTDLAAVVAPPYDVISPAQRDALYDRDPHNVVRLILNRSEDPYTDAAATLDTWRREQVLTQDAEPAIGYHVEHFSLPDGGRRTRTGILAAVRLEDLDSGVIRPHERTFARAKEDRLRLITACRTNLSAIFGMFDGQPDALDPLRGEALRRRPDIEVHDDMGVGHRLWLVREADVVAAVTNALLHTTIFIADGHHRYETALAYRERRRAEGSNDAEDPCNYVLMYLASTADPGLVILPTHRVLSGPSMPGAAAVVDRLRTHFDLETLPRQELHRRLLQGTRARQFGVVLAGQGDGLLASMRDEAALESHLRDLHPSVRSLDVAILDSAVLRGLLGIDCTAAAQQGRLTYTHDDAAAFAAVAADATAAFLMAPPRIDDVVTVCLAGQTMPQKSTYFFPKLLTGLVFHSLD